MTLIITEIEDGRVVMGADSAVGSLDEVYTRPLIEKIYKRGPYLVGVCGSARVSQILRVMEWPEPPAAEALPAFVIRDLAPAIRRAVDEAGALQPGRAILGEKTVIVMAVRARVFAFGCDLSMVPTDGPTCIGHGRHAAYPTLAALQDAGVGPARQRIEKTLHAVSQHSLYVRPPFRFLESS